MSDKINIDLDQTFLSKFYMLTGAGVPDLATLNLAALQEQLNEICALFENIKEENTALKEEYDQLAVSEPVGVEAVVEETLSKTSITSLPSNFSLKIPAKKSGNPAVLNTMMNYKAHFLRFIDPRTFVRDKKQYYDDDGKPVRGRILVVDDLGVVNYQLSAVFKRAGFYPVSSKEIFDAVEKFKRDSFDFVIIDLFLPTAREGFILFDEFKKIAEAREDTTIIGIMSTSTKKEHKQFAQRKGAAFYAEKVETWQRDIFDLVNQFFP